MRDPEDVLWGRLRHQRAIAPMLGSPEEVVSAQCAVQAQDYRGALWGIGHRTVSAGEGDVERAITERTIVRTWPMRGTLHFVAAPDVRWMLRLLTPRIVARSAGRRRQLDLDAATLAKSATRLEAALGGGRALTRRDVFGALERSGIVTSGQRGIHILAELAMRGVLCFGAREGRQPTFVLLDEWIPSSRTLERDEAVGELARRYFTSHGPATLGDFAWWSGLSLGDARRGLEVAGDTLATEADASKTRWITATETARVEPTRRTTIGHLLPAYDEYTVAYRDRSAFLEARHATRARNGIFSPVVLMNGRIVGTWRRLKTGKGVVLAAELFEPPIRGARTALEAVAKRYADFCGLPASLDLKSP